MIFGTQILAMEGKSKKHLSLVGQDFKNNVIINCILPLLYEEIINNDNFLEMAAFRDFYNSLPAILNQKTRYLAHRLFGDKPRGKILEKAISQQAVFQLHEDFCLHFETSCEGCTFVEKYKMTKIEDR